MKKLQSFRIRIYNFLLFLNPPIFLLKLLRGTKIILIYLYKYFMFYLYCSIYIIKTFVTNNNTIFLSKKLVYKGCRGQKTIWEEKQNALKKNNVILFLFCPYSGSISEDIIKYLSKKNILILLDLLFFQPNILAFRCKAQFIKKIKYFSHIRIYTF